MCCSDAAVNTKHLLAVQATWAECMAHRDSLALHGLTPQATVDSVQRAFAAALRRQPLLHGTTDAQHGIAAAAAAGPAAPGPAQADFTASSSAADSLRAYVAALLHEGDGASRDRPGWQEVLQLVLHGLDSGCAGGHKLRALVSKLAGECTDQDSAPAAAQQQSASTQAPLREPVSFTSPGGTCVELGPCPLPEDFLVPRASTSDSAGNCGGAALTAEQCTLDAASAPSASAPQPASGRRLAEVLALPADPAFVARVKAAQKARKAAAQTEGGASAENDSAAANTQAGELACDGSSSGGSSSKGTSAAGCTAGRGKDAETAAVLDKFSVRNTARASSLQHALRQDAPDTCCAEAPAVTVRDALALAAQVDEDLGVCCMPADICVLQRKCHAHKHLTVHLLKGSSSLSAA